MKTHSKQAFLFQAKRKYKFVNELTNERTYSLHGRPLECLSGTGGYEAKLEFPKDAMFSHLSAAL